MHDLTQRQIEVLKAIIREFTDTGEPVGSEILEKKYRLGVSPATIRNEMVQLAKKGYLKKTHFSSGRVPSAHGFRFYIRNIMKEKEMSTFDEVAYKNSIWDDRHDEHRLLFHATKVLAQRTGLLSLTVTDAGDLYYSGIANLLNKNEFLNLDLSRSLFGLLDEDRYWNTVLRQLYALEEDLMYMLGEEDFRNPVFESCASVIGEFEGPRIKGFIGVVGPKRMMYEEIIPQVRFFSGLIRTIMMNHKI
jgi:heat-inducible transcriptional repressor